MMVVWNFVRKKKVACKQTLNVIYCFGIYLVYMYFTQLAISTATCFNILKDNFLQVCVSLGEHRSAIVP